MKVIKHISDIDNGISILIKDKKIKVWLDVYINKDNDMVIDWNKYIFFMVNPEDVKIKKYQEDVSNYEKCTELCTDYVLNNKLIYESNKGLLYFYPSKEEIIEYQTLHNEDEVGMEDLWSYSDAEYHLLLSDKYQ